jgi:hypothetical protein
MPEAAQLDLLPAVEVARDAPLRLAANGIHYAVYGDTQLASSDLDRIVLAVPKAIAAALDRKAYYFVPLVIEDLGEAGPYRDKSSPVLIARGVTSEATDLAVCHRNATCILAECVFISTRLMQDRFALAFEFYINTGHHFVDAVGVPESFADLVWAQAVANVRGESSQDAWEQRARAMGRPSDSPSEHAWAAPASAPSSSTSASSRLRDKGRLTAVSQPKASQASVHAVDEKARTEYLEAAFADAIAIYMLSMTVDFDYTELREREYPLLAAPALAERLRHIARIFPANPGHEFSIRYRRRSR